MAHLELALAPVPSAPAWLQQQDQQVIASISAALNSRMHRERWKYTKTQPILDLIRSPCTQPQLGTLPTGVSLSLLERDAPQAPLTPDIAAAPEACSALCYQDQIMVLQVDREVTDPLTITHTGNSLPMVIKLAANARLDLREYFTSDMPQHQSLWLELGPGSQVSHARNSFNGGTHWQFLRVNIGRDAAYKLYNHCSGAQLRRQDVQIICADAGAQAEISSAAFVAANTHLDQQITIEHAAPHTTSNQTFHNIAGDKAKVTFNGRIHIHAHANGTDAHLSNKNLAMGEHAVINTKPELEIYTDDVACSHGATVGQLDESHLFYCASRGIDPARAKQLLSQAFLNVCIQGPAAEEARTVFQTLADA